MRNNNPLKSSTYAKQEEPAPQKAAPKLPDRSSLRDRMKELDESVNQPALDFEEFKREQRLATSKTFGLVPEAVKQDALKRCKERGKRMGTNGFGSSWSMLQMCVSNELDAYLVLKQTYGYSLSDIGVDSPR